MKKYVTCFPGLLPSVVACVFTLFVTCSTACAAAPMTPQEEFFSAVEKKDCGRVRQLIAAGEADVNGVMTSEECMTALHVAAMQCGLALRSLDVVRALLEAPGIDVNKKNNVGQTPLHLVCGTRTPETAAIVRALLDHPDIDLDAVDTYQQSALHYAAFHNSLAAVTELLRQEHPWLARVCVNAKSSEGKTALMLAIEKHNWDVACKIVEDRDTEINMRDNDEWPALHQAVFEKGPRVVRAILAKELVLPTIVDKDGTSALHLAARLGFASIVSILLEGYAKILVSSTDRYNQTPLQIARRAGHTQVATLIEESIVQQRLPVR